MNLLQGAARKVSGRLGRESWLIRHLRPGYESLLDVSTNGNGIPWKINGATYRVDPRYRHRLGQNYDAPVAAFIRERIKPGAVCVDVGANVGVYVLQFAHWSGERGRVIAFEPNPGALEVLQKHIELNDLTERVEVVPAAVGARCGSATLFAAGADGMSRLGAPNELIAEQVEEITVPVVTLDNFCAEHDLKPDWLFIDIEGFEIAALEGARQLIKVRGLDLNIIVEMHPDVWGSADTTRAGAEALLDEIRLCAVPLTGQTDPLGEYGLVYLKHRTSHR
jgi:FkbM family methyltransferase